jgi:uncharacterized damage-inducible protein DinB
MTVREFYIDRQQAELPLFLKVFKALPPGSDTYKPAPDSPTAGQVVWTVANGMRASLDVAIHFKVEWKALAAPPLEDMVKIYEQCSRDLVHRVSRMDDHAWNRDAQFYHEGKLVSQQPAGRFLWFILFDAIHHRGQLSAYLRPMGARVPSIYGPSADERLTRA